MWDEAERYLLKDKYLGSFVKKHRPCKIRPSKKGDYFSDLVESIIGQQLSGTAANSIFNKLKRQLKGDIAAKKILTRKDKTLRNCGLSFSKINYIKNLSKKVVDGEINIKRLNESADDKIISVLTEVKGIGNWTAEMFLMFSLARPDVFPVDDLGIRKGLNIMFGSKQYSRIIVNKGSRWKPFRTCAAYYIWKSVDNK